MFFLFIYHFQLSIFIYLVSFYLTLIKLFFKYYFPSLFIYCTESTWKKRFKFSFNLLYPFCVFYFFNLCLIINNTSPYCSYLSPLVHILFYHYYPYFLIQFYHYLFLFAQIIHFFKFIKSIKSYSSFFFMNIIAL